LPSFGIKKLLSGLSKDTVKKIVLKRHGQLFLLLTLLHMHFFFLGFSLSDAKFMGGEYLNESLKVIY